jgi:outer membrane protein
MTLAGRLLPRSLPRLGRPLALAAGLAAGLATALPARAETLTDALISAYRNSHLLEQNRALLRAADEDVAGAFAALRPVLNYAVAANRSYDAGIQSGFAATATLSASLLLYDFGRSRMAVDLAKETVLATRWALLGIEQNVLFSAVDAYMTVISTAEFVQLQQNNVRLITEELRAANDRFELGEVTRTDVSIAEAALAAARASLAAAQGDYTSARESYRAAVGHFPGTLAPAPQAPQTARTLEEAKSIGLKTHPSIKQAQRSVNADELAIAIALAAMKPSLTANARVEYDDQGDMAEQLGLQLSGPIYNGGALSATYRQAVARRDADRSNLLQAANLVEQNIGLAWARVAVARAQLSSSNEQIRAATVAYQGVREEATLGARTTLDVLNAQASRISAYSDLYTANYALLQQMGLLTVEHLQLGIPTYDPEAYYNAVKDAPVRKVSPQGQRLDRVLKALGKN